MRGRGRGRGGKTFSRGGGQKTEARDAPAESEPAPEPQQSKQDAPEAKPKGKANKEAPRHKKVTPSAPKNDNLFSESVFAQDLSDMTQSTRRTKFSVTMAGLMEVIDSVYAVYQAASKDFERCVCHEAFTYYCFALIQLRIAQIRLEQGGTESTQQDRALKQTVAGVTFNVPKPLLVFLDALGDLTTATGESLRIDLPAPGNDRANGSHVGGFYSKRLNVQTHYYYEDMPALGMAAHVLMAASANALDPANVESPFISVHDVIPGAPPAPPPQQQQQNQDHAPQDQPPPNANDPNAQQLQQEGDQQQQAAGIAEDAQDVPAPQPNQVNDPGVHGERIPLTRNALGYRLTTTYRKRSQIQLLNDAGVTPDEFTEDARSTGFNLALMLRLSEAIGSSQTFPSSVTGFDTLAITGSKAIILPTMIDHWPSESTRCSRCDVRVQSLYAEGATDTGLAITYGFQLEKSRESANDDRPWSAHVGTNGTAPLGWWDNRLTLRRLPMQYGIRVFTGIPRARNAFVQRIVKDLSSTR